MKTTVLLFLALTVGAQAAQKKKTVGEFLSQVQQASRGGKMSGAEKNNTALPNSRHDLGFAHKTNADMEAVKPPKANEILRTAATGDLAEYERILNRQIDELYKLTQKFKNSENRGELWLRLAELYVEKSVLVDSRKQDEFDKQVKLFNEGKTKRRPVLDVRQARELNRKAIQLYEWFLKDFPHDAKVPQALFFLGFNNFELNQFSQGAKYYEKLIKNFPKSSFVGEAQFSLAEYYFENEKWTLAYNRYAPLIKNKRHRLHNYSVYKGAWCLYRLGQYNQALKYLESIIRGSQVTEDQELASKRVVNKERLENEALRDIVAFYAADRNAENAPAYFKSLTGKDDVTSYIEKLAYYYTDKGNGDGARYCFKYLIEQKPMSPVAFEYQYQVVQNYFYAKNTSRFRDELYGWVKTYSKDSEWAQANKNNPDLIAKSQKLRETTLRNYILQQHQTAQNSRAPFSQATASEGYKIYLQEFPQSLQTPDMHFYYGELLYDMKKYNEATDQYRWVVENAPQSKFYMKAANNIIHAAEKSLPSDQEMQKRVGNSTDPIALDPRVESFIKAADWYIAKFPKDEKTPELKFRTARLYYQHNQFDKANELFTQVVQQYPRTKYSEYSANLILDIFNLKKDYIGLEKTGQALLKVPEIASSKAGGEIRGILEKASFKKAQDLEKAGNHEESAKQFEAFAMQNPKSDLAVTATYNAAVNYEKTGDLVKAIPLYTQVTNTKGDAADKLKPNVHRFLAKIYQNASLFEDSITHYKAAIQTNPKDPLVVNYEYNIAVMSEALGRNEDAVHYYTDYLAKTNKSSEKKDVHYSLAMLAEKLNHHKAAIENFESYLTYGGLDPNKQAEAYHELEQLYKHSRTQEAEKYQQRILSFANKTKNPMALKYASEAKLERAMVTSTEFKAVKLPADPKKQAKAVENKIQLLNKLTKELNDIVQMNSGETIVSSLTVLGEANQHMADSVLNAPIPKGLNAQETELYKKEIKKITDPFQQKAQDSYKLAVQRGQELDVYTPDYEKAYNFMSKVDSKSYPNNGEKIFETRFVKWSVP